MAPRYISALKLHLGINISPFTVLVLLFWCIFVRRIWVYARVESCFFLIWLLLILGSFWRAEKWGVWLYYLIWSATAVLFQQILIKFSNNNTNIFIIKALTDALFIHLLIGLYEITRHTYLFETGEISVRLYGHVAISIFHNLNDYATFVTTMIPFAVYRFTTSERLIGKIYCLFLVLASLYLIIISESRGAMLTLIVFTCVGIITFARKSNKNRLITAGAFLVFIILLVADFREIKTVLLRLIINNSINIAGRSDIARINLIKNGLYFLSQTYGFGVGAGNLYEWLGTRSIYPIGGLRFLHNWYAEILVTFGVAFFALYFFFHIKILYVLWSKKYGSSTMKTAAFLSFVCFSIVSISSSSNVYSEWVWMYLVFISMVSAYLQKTEVPKTEFLQ